jgi:acyl-CoA synthetase (AMP-forming)/AMP-acid ligase II
LISSLQVRDIHVETDESLGPRKEGEICIRGALVMKGYLNNPEATKNCMEEDGWLRTGVCNIPVSKDDVTHGVTGTSLLLTKKIIF